jgi:hypothetical protein
MKKREEYSYGRFYWGYSGTLCHPSRIHHFVKQINIFGSNDSGSTSIILVLAYTPSIYFSKIGRINQYSVDKKVWFSLPSDVLLTGCQYAIVGKDLKRIDSTIDLNNYTTVLGDKIGKPLGEYIRYHVNKACAIFYPNSSLQEKIVRVAYVGELISPYCVYVRC